MRHLQIILILISLPLSAIVRADSAAVVECLQLPAWLERNGIRHSLTLGMSLQPQDTVETGPGARQKLSKAGYAAVVRQALSNGRTWYRVSIPGFVNKTEAQAFQANIIGKFGITKPWISWLKS